MLEALLCAVPEELRGLWTQQSAMHQDCCVPHVVQGHPMKEQDPRYVYRHTDNSLLLSLEGDMHFSLKTYYP